MIPDKIFMDIAEVIASNSKCIRAKVGAIIVKENNIIAIGYNGTPKGWPNDCEENGVTKKEVLHAESNALAKCAGSQNSALDSTMYITHSPCPDCAKIIIQSGIKRVCYKQKYNDLVGVGMLIRHGLETEQIV